MPCDLAMASSLKTLLLHEVTPSVWTAVAETLRHAAAAVADGAATPDELCNLVAASRRAAGERTPTLNALHAVLTATPPEGPAGPLGKASPAVIQFAATLALQLPELFPQGGPEILRAGSGGQVFLTRRKIASLLAASLFAALPGHAAQCRDSSGELPLDLPEFNLQFVLQADKTKTKCLLCYFARIAAADEAFLDEEVSFGRRCEAGKLEGASWRALEKPLLPLQVVSGAIEDAHELLQADFANEYLGGGALQGGNVQEEIRFAVCPECIVGMLFCEKMEPYEALFIVGALQYSRYEGYGGSFKFVGPTDAAMSYTLPADARNRRGPHIVALDALVFPGSDQYKEGYILRELRKSYVACLGDPSEDAGPRRCGFATGNWGCGVFGGDPELKALIQWLSASAADREVAYYPFGDKRVARLQEVVDAVQESGCTCGELYGLLQAHTKGSVFSCVLKRARQSASL